MTLQSKHSFKKSLLVTSIALALSACGSSGSGSDTVSFSGTVADGYLVDARVCLDLNDNKVCDEGEPRATTSAGGEFTIDGVTQAQLDLHALVVEIVEGITVDEDFPDQVIDEAYSMTAPAGYNFVSPLTTMVQQEIEDNEDNDDFDVEDAEQAVQAKLGTNLDLREDFVAAKGEDSDFTEAEKAEFEKLHKVAQVTARVLQDNVVAVKEAVEETDITFDQIMEMVVGEVLEALETINQEVEEAVDAGGDFDPDAVAANEDITDEALIDTQEVDVEAEIAAREAEKAASSANLIELVTTVGINWFEADHHEGGLELFYGSFFHNTDTGESEDTEYYYDAANSVWVMDDEQGSDSDYLLTSLGWVSAEDNEEISINADGSITVANAEVSTYAERLDASQFDIAGLNIASTLAMAGHDMAWADAVDPLAAFSEGALGFKLTFTTLNDQYRMWDWDCDDSTGTGGMCNSVWLNTGDGNHETDGPASTLVSMISQTAGTPTNAGEVKGAQVAWTHGGSIYAELVAGGNVNYYFTQWHRDGTSTADLIAEGTWDDQQVGDVSLIVMELPPVVVGEGELDFRDRFIFFTEKDGYVRRGEYMPAGTVEHGEVVFNAIAKEDILAAFSGSHFDVIADEIETEYREDQEEENASDSTGGAGNGEDPTQADGTVEESTVDEGPEPLVTTLQYCETGDSEEDSLSGVVDLSSGTEFEAAISACGGAQTIAADLISGKTFIIADQPNETVEFVGETSGSAIIREMLPTGSEELVEEMAWSIESGKLILEGVDEGVAFKETIALLESDDSGALELSLKGFAEEADVSQMDGTLGEIWSGILVEQSAVQQP